MLLKLNLFATYQCACLKYFCELQKLKLLRSFDKRCFLIVFGKYLISTEWIATYHSLLHYHVSNVKSVYVWSGSEGLTFFCASIRPMQFHDRDILDLTKIRKNQRKFSSIILTLTSSTKVFLTRICYVLNFRPQNRTIS